MALRSCPSCNDDKDLFLVRDLGDGRKLIGCSACGTEWAAGQATRQVLYAPPTFATLKRDFPKPQDVDPQHMAKAEALKEQFLEVSPEPDPRVAPYWAKYQHIFSREWLFECDPKLLKDFANSEVGAHPGNQSMFNEKWNEMGTERAAESTRRTIEYLLYGPDGTAMEDRLNHLLQGAKSFAMPGFKEALLTRVLCVVQPDRYLSILKYTTEAGGKREIARAVYGLELPNPDATRLTRGRLLVWSNDLLHSLVGGGFVNQPHAAAFLWWAKDREIA